jgi:hypothetical protein
MAIEPIGIESSILVSLIARTTMSLSLIMTLFYSSMCVNNNNIYSGSSTHRSVFHGGPVIYIYIYIIHGKLYYAYLKTIKYLQMDYI